MCSAFSVLGSVAGALGGLLLGSRGLVATAVPCYVLAWLIVLLRTRSGLRFAPGEDALSSELEAKGASCSSRGFQHREAGLTVGAA